MSNFLITKHDFISATQRWKDWVALAWYDFSLPYRRTLIGPLWKVVQFFVWVVALSIIFKQSELEETKNYVLYVSCGVMAFGFISEVISSSPNIFLQNSTQILNIPIPFMMLIYRSVCLSIINFLFQLPVLFLIFLCIGKFDLCIFTLFLTLLIYFITAIWTSLLLAMIGVRFKDLKYSVQSVMRLLFFISPVFWSPGLSKTRTLLATYNPISYFMEIFRLPFFGSFPSIKMWSVVLFINIIGIISTTIIFIFFKRRISLWL